MGILNLLKRNKSPVGYIIGNTGDDFCVPGYTSLAHNPEILTGCRVIASLISSMTIHLMSNTEQGDVRINNELSRFIDINPNPNMTRRTWMEIIVMDMLLYGRGNSIVTVETENGLLQSMTRINPSRISYIGNDYEYKVKIDGVEFAPDELLHFVFVPDEARPWKGKGVTVALNDVAQNLRQEQHTVKGFMQSKWKPSIVVKVDAMIEEFATKEGRQKILESYVESSEAGEPWLVPAEQFQIDQIRPLSLADLAISDAIKLDRSQVAFILGVPSFLLGVGEFNRGEWNNFIKSFLMPLAKSIEQELTRKLIISPKWYLKFNIRSLMSYDLNEISAVFCALGDRGYVSGNEVRDEVGFSPREGLDELRILENYIPAEMSGKQKKLKGEGDE